MELIFHEKQEGSLCAQHCLNALLQGPYFTPVDLASLASKMDEEERMRMAELGIDTEDYQKFLQQPSGNMDDSGYFSVQVISSALEVWGLELTPYNSSEPAAVIAQNSPQDMSAFICNYRDHWFTIRKLGYQWFNLNSLLSGPELISPTYLTIFLAQLQQEGYSIFIVIGELPACPVDDVLKETPAVQSVKPKLNTTISTEDSDLQKALRMSMSQSEEEDDSEMIQAAIQRSLEDEADPSLDRAIQLSLNTNASSPSTSSNTSRIIPPNRPSFASSKPTAKQPGASGEPKSDDEELTEAINLSLQEYGDSPRRVVNIPIQNIPPLMSVHGDEADLAEIRRRRLAYLEAKAAKNKR